MGHTESRLLPWVIALLALPVLLSPPVRAAENLGPDTGAEPRWKDEVLGRRWKASLDYTRDSFSTDLDPWNQFTLALNHGFPGGSVIVRGNFAERFGAHGSQAELDAWPRLGPGTYAYLNYGASGAAFFPEHRLGGEVFHSLGSGFEGSLGFRRLWFTSSLAHLWTGTLTRYLGAWYFSLRPYWVPSSLGPSVSATLTARRYLDDESYLELALGAGTSVDQRYGTLETFSSGSRKLGAAAHLLISGATAVNPAVSWSELQVRPGVDRAQTSLSIGIEQGF